MRARTQPAPSATALADHYTGGHDRRALGWMHDARITTAITLARFLLDGQTPERVADLSCGAPHAEVARAFHAPTITAGRYATEGNARRTARALHRRLRTEGRPDRVTVIEWHPDHTWHTTWEADDA